ncbi:Glutamate/Leucine/Phenylalanine/Valine dehydrogenase-domain-containing protein [Paraphysoderma sedebokerense]|nr:Glutamate/Leucine/Phenylalanine/Valine dehydrogenase-domain-containing protein [Paraphysoderma sedebokerense]
MGTTQSPPQETNRPQKRKQSFTTTPTDIPISIHHPSTNRTSRTRIHFDTSFNELCSTICDVIFGDTKELGNGELKLRYLDEEKEQVELNCEFDWVEAKNVWVGVLGTTLHIIVANRGVSSGDMSVHAEAIHDTPGAQVLIRELNSTHEMVSMQTVSWFLRNMPKAYFREIDEETRLSHIRALIALRLTGGKQDLSLVNKDKTIYTYIKSANYLGLLSEVVESLPKDKPLREANIYTSQDNTFILDVFHFDGTDQHDHLNSDLKLGVKFTGESVEEQTKMAEILQYLQFVSPSNSIVKDEKSHLLQFLSRCDAAYVLSTSSNLIYHHYIMCTSRSLTNGSTVRIIDEPAEIDSCTPGQAPTDWGNSCNISSQACLIYVAKPVEYRDLFSRIVKHLRRLGVDIIKAKLNRIRLPENGVAAKNMKNGDTRHDQNVLILTCYIRSEDDKIDVSSDNPFGKRVREDLARINWLDESVLIFADKHRDYSLIEAEIVVAFTQLLHCILTENKPLVYTMHHMFQFVAQYSTITKAITGIFLEKFAPIPENALETRIEHLHQAYADITRLIDETADMEDTKLFFHFLLSVVMYTLKTNLHFPDRLALLLRLDPQLFNDKVKSININLPFGVFFGFGRGFIGFHTRFRDIARGGVRIITPGGQEQYMVANRGLIAEGFGLASAQQLKNKDIPEGGSKGVILLQPHTIPVGAFKSFTDGLLDLTVTKNAASMADYYGKEELLYLGPDENVSNSLIEWICKRAEERGHPFPSTFMSSKPGAGINHKQYGVTSEGVTVFLDVALRRLGFDPKKQRFTVKLTGGPDGDVAGNEIKILHREYGPNASIVAIADGSGVAEDPEGLDHSELLRLVEESLPIIEFQKEKLSKHGVVMSVSAADGAKMRNTMHFRVTSDVFIPAGGRPYTINDNNWKHYIDQDGRPKSKLIVEGANIFLSPNARFNLSKAGVVIVKDSSANKCGVICSSFEILAGMLADEISFLQLKESYVQDVLDRLRHLAKVEAELLFRDAASHPDPNIILPEISIQISKTIIQVADSVERYLESLSPTTLTSVPTTPLQKFLNTLLINYVPKTLHSLPNFDTRIRNIPLAYMKGILASSIASTVVYREGMLFGIINRKHEFELQSSNHIGSTSHNESQIRIGMLAVRYLQEAEKMKVLVSVVQGISGMDEDVKKQVIVVLEKGGARVALDNLGMRNS